MATWCPSGAYRKAEYFSLERMLQFEDFLAEFGNNLMIFNTNFYDYEDYLLTSALQIAPLLQCQQVSAF